MAEEVQDDVWPLPKFYFSVELPDVGDALAFQEVTGLDIESDVMEDRAANSKAFSPIKMPGMHKSGTITLHKGVFTRANGFWDWFNQIKLNTIKRQTVTIKLLDEGGNATMVWTLANAFPTKVNGTDLKSDGNEVAVESIELAYEGLTIENGG